MYRATRWWQLKINNDIETMPCSCGDKFRDGEDFRDHLPCPGPKDAINERKMICKWLMLMQIMPHKEPADYASMIERSAHRETPLETINKYMEKK